ncbi:MAG: DUF87 domain-containing protein [Sedimenticola sp.]
MPKTSLSQLLQGIVETRDDVIPTPLFLGSFALNDNPSFSRKILDKYAEQTGSIPTYSEFLDCFKSPAKALEPPKKDDPKFTAYDQELSPQQRKIKSLTLYQLALRKHDQRNLGYQALQTRSRAIAQAFNADFRGYISFISCPSFASGTSFMPKSLGETDRFFFTSAQEFRINESERERHTYITAGTGHGKSVTLETIINHYLTANTGTAVVLLDPHGDLAISCARLASNATNERLVYIKPAIKAGGASLTPVLNPFEIQVKTWDEINKATDALIEVFREVMKSDGTGTNFTPQMETILKPCIAALLHREGSSFLDLVRFLDDDLDEYKPYLNFARRVLTNPMHLEALNKDFMKDSFNPSKLSIKTKVRNLLNDDYFFNFLVGKSTFDLEEAIERKAFVVFDLSGLTDKAKDAIGRFIMATMTSLAISRANLPYSRRVPVHLVVDECQNFVSDSMKTILTEARKFRLYGTFAQQFCGQGMNTEMKRTIIGNSNIKITGKNGLDSLKIMSAETGAPIEELQKLDPGEFHIQAGSSPSSRVKVPMMEEKDHMTREQWAKVKADQVRRYYRHIITHQPNQKPDQPPADGSPSVVVTPTDYDRKPQPLQEAKNNIATKNSKRGKDLKNPFE